MKHRDPDENELTDGHLRSGHDEIQLAPATVDRIRNALLVNQRQQNEAEPIADVAKSFDRVGSPKPLFRIPSRSPLAQTIAISVAAVVVLALGFTMLYPSHPVAPIVKQNPHRDAKLPALIPPFSSENATDDGGNVSHDKSPQSVVNVQDHIAVAIPSRHSHIEIVQIFPVFDPKKQ